MQSNKIKKDIRGLAQMRQTRPAGRAAALAAFITCFAFCATVLGAGPPAGDDSALTRAESLVREKKFADAVEVYEKLVDKGSRIALKRIGPLYFALGRHQDALKVYGKAVKQHPDVAWYWHCLAHALRKAGRPREAAVAYEKALKLKPGDPGPLYGMAQAYLAMGLKAKAANVLRRFISSEKRAWATRWVAAARRQLKKVTAAPTRPGSRPEVLALLAKANKAQAEGNTDQALQFCYKAVRLARADGRIYRTMVNIFIKAGRPADAKRWLRLSLRRVAKFHWARLTLAVLHRKADQLSQALYHMRIYLSDSPSEPYGLMEMGKLYLKQQKTKEAHEQFLKALKAAKAARRLKAYNKAYDLVSQTASALGVPAPPKEPPGAPPPTTPPPRVTPPVTRPVAPPVTRPVAPPVTRPVVARPTPPRPRPRPVARPSKPSKKPVPAALAPAVKKAEAGQWGDVLKVAEPYLKANPTSYHAMVLVAEGLLKELRDLARARRLADLARLADPTAAAPYRLSGLLELKFRNRTKAKTHFEAFLKYVDQYPKEQKHKPLVNALLKRL
jgi:tetratricopeptide (TPR) repeat protein